MNEKHLKVFIRTNQKSYLICSIEINKLQKFLLQNLSKRGRTLYYGKTVPWIKFSSATNFPVNEVCSSLEKLENTVLISSIRVKTWAQVFVQVIAVCFCEPRASRMLRRAVTMTCWILIRHPPFWKSNGGKKAWLPRRMPSRFWALSWQGPLGVAGKGLLTAKKSPKNKDPIEYNKNDVKMQKMPLERNFLGGGGGGEYHQIPLQKGLESLGHIT